MTQFRFRHRNSTWRVDADPGIAGGQLCVLQDIRDALQQISRLLHCPNTVRMPAILDQIATNTQRPKRKKATKRGRK